MSIEHDYEYGVAGRLTEVKKNDEVTEAYDYDQNSNRTQTTYAAGPSADTKTATFDNRDRMTTYGDLELAYNADGELTSKTDTVANEATTFEYSTFGRLTSATLPTGQQITYITDGTGNHVARQVNGQTTSAY
ncbi:MAG: RHS repeat protein, partial [Solirubrobacterales bacterium]